MKLDGKPSPLWVKSGGNRGERTRRSRKNERQLAERLGGRGLPRSGGAAWQGGFGATHRGDFQFPGFHAELKETEAQSIGVKREWLTKVRKGASRTLGDPALVVKFIGSGAAPDDTWVAVPLAVFERLLKHYEESS